MTGRIPEASQRPLFPLGRRKCCVWLPIFVWSHYATSIILVLATPVLAENSSHGFELVRKPYSVEALSRVLRKAISKRAFRNG